MIEFVREIWIQSKNQLNTSKYLLFYSFPSFELQNIKDKSSRLNYSHALVEKVLFEIKYFFLKFDIIFSEQRRSLLSEKELEFAEHLIGYQIEHLQNEVFNKVERWANEGFGLGQMAKWGKHFADDKYVILK